MEGIAGKTVIFAIGLFALLGGVMNWDFFMNHRKTQIIIKMFGRNGARVFYGILGTGIMLFGVAWMIGIVKI